MRPRIVVTSAVLGAVLLCSGCSALDTAPGGPSVLRGNGAVDATAYRTLAQQLATPRGIRYRFGDAASGDRTTTTVWGPQPSTALNSPQALTPRDYQIGGPQDDALNDFSSNQAQVGYTPTRDSPEVGVDHLETLAMTDNTLSERPQLSWTYYGGGHPEPAATTDPKISTTAKCLSKLDRRPGRFVAQARAYAHGEATANSMLVFDNGVIVMAGTNTAPGDACAALSTNLRPSGVSLTNGNEFALITAWNTETLRSELVVLALGAQRVDKDFWGFEWQQLYPGVRNYGRPTFLKVLGSIELPMAAATSVSAVSDDSSAQPLSKPGGGNAYLGDLTLDVEANRQSFISGVNAGTIATAGYAVVASREEKKVAFIDLQPLFDRITGEYFRSRETFNRIGSTTGTGPDEWPKSFGSLPEERPVVVKTITTTSSPSAVAGMLSGPETPRAYVATEDGHLLVFDVGGLASAADALATDITQVGSIAVGLNPTDITYVKDRTTGNAVPQSLDDTLIVTARGSRAVQWIHLAGPGGKVTRTLRDSRLVDPIAAEDNNTHGTESYLLSIADYCGGDLANYRYGPVIFHTNGGARYGMGPDGTAEFEYGGAYRPGGHPFSISITNVT